MPTAPRRSGALAAALAVTASLAGAHLVDIWLLGHATGHPLTTVASRGDLLTPLTILIGIAALVLRVVASAGGAPATSGRVLRVAAAAHAVLFVVEVLEQAVMRRADVAVLLAIAVSAVAHVMVSAVVVVGSSAARRVGERVASRGHARRRKSVSAARWTVSQQVVRTRRVGVGGLALRAPPVTV